MSSQISFKKAVLLIAHKDEIWSKGLLLGCHVQKLMCFFISIRSQTLLWILHGGGVMLVAEDKREDIR